LKQNYFEFQKIIIIFATADRIAESRSRAMQAGRAIGLPPGMPRLDRKRLSTPIPDCLEICENFKRQDGNRYRFLRYSFANHYRQREDDRGTPDIMKKLLFFAIALCSAFAVNAQANSLQKSMLDTFVKYAKIDSQSNEDSVCTQGQRNMAAALLADVKDAVSANRAKGVEYKLSDENYVYVTIPSNMKGDIPTFGISCHLDVTPEGPGKGITPIVDTLNGHTIVRTDGTTLLGADDKCGCTIAMSLIRTLLSDSKIKHGKVMFAFCPNEDVGRAADAIDTICFNPDILYDIDGEEYGVVTQSNFTARGFNVKFLGHDVHPAKAKELKYGDATGAAATFIAFFPPEIRPENTEGTQGYIHAWNFDKKEGESDVTVHTRVRYFDAAEGKRFEQMLKDALAKVARDYPNVGIEILYDGLQYENVAYTLHPEAKNLVCKAADKLGINVRFEDERGGTTASMFAAKGLKGGMCVFAGQHGAHSVNEYADLAEMEESYLLMLEIIKAVPSLK